MVVEDAITFADKVLRGEASYDIGGDPKWQVMIEVAMYIESEPKAVWDFVLRWAEDPDADIRSGISCCLLEHLLEYHFSLIFPLARNRALESRLFTETLGACWAFGQAKEPQNAAMVAAMFQDLKRTWPEVGKPT